MRVVCTLFLILILFTFPVFAQSVELDGLKLNFQFTASEWSSLKITYEQVASDFTIRVWHNTEGYGDLLIAPECYDKWNGDTFYFQSNTCKFQIFQGESLKFDSGWLH